MNLKCNITLTGCASPPTPLSLLSVPGVWRQGPGWKNVEEKDRIKFPPLLAFISPGKASPLGAAGVVDQVMRTSD
ncbi:hypothetical protein CHARACLAT_018297 [Characodon lateralis]|uniref:Uncharacterized protein n=1 Tax=Characodon lateralis TaxID=208331 RepID=A0ABU7EUM7_9TELE|nr:hypothetical protein [Characodon lateralis]